MRNKITQFIISFAVSWHGFSAPPILINPNHPDFWVNAIAESAQKNVNVQRFEFDKKIDLIDMTNGENGLLIAPGFLQDKLNNTESDMLEAAWLCYAFNKSPQLSRDKTAFQSEYDAILAYLQSVDQYVIKHKIYPKDKTTIQLSIWRKNKDLKMAILFLLYEPKFENELKNFLINNPNSVAEFFRKYSILPNSSQTKLRPASGTRLLNGKIISTLTIRIAKTHDYLSKKDNKFEKIITKFNLIHNYSPDKNKQVPQSIEIWTIKTTKNILYSYLVRVLDPFSEKALAVVSDIDGLPISTVP